MKNSPGESYENLDLENEINRSYLKTDEHKVKRESTNIHEVQIDFLKKLLPHLFTEDKIDFKKFKNYFEKNISNNDVYSFNWAGRNESFLNIKTTAKTTLNPSKNESINFDSTKNIFIEGDNLEVLKLLQKSYFNKIKMIYIDPPYNTGNDFVYKDNFTDSIQTYLEQTGQINEDGFKLTTNPETSGRFHSEWITMMYSRLFLARNLLKNDGIIFVSIDDHEIHNLKMIMNEIFGEENFIDCLIWKKRYGGGAKEKYLVTLHEYVLCYAKDISFIDPIFIPLNKESIKRYYKLKDSNYDVRGPYRTHPLEAVKSMGHRKNLVYPIKAPDGTEINPKRQWLWSKERVEAAIANNELEFVKSRDGWTVNTKQYLKDENGQTRQAKAFSIIDDVYTQHGTNEIINIFKNARIFPYPKPTGFIKQLINIGLDSNDIILDFFAGSGTTAHSVLELNREDNCNRKFILIQIPEPTSEKSEAYKEGFINIAEICKERIRRVIKSMPTDQTKLIDNDQDLGFKVFKLAKSNYKVWEEFHGNDSKELIKQLSFFDSPLVDEYKGINVIYECIIKEGYNLNSKIEKIDISSNKIFKVTDDERTFFISLDLEIKENIIEQLNFDKDTVFICLDNALNDTKKSNLALQCHLKTI